MVIFQLVKFFARNENDNNWDYCGPFVASCKRLLAILLKQEPDLKLKLLIRKRNLIKCVESLGKHGLIGTANEDLVHLHRALKEEFEKVREAYSEGLKKLEELKTSKECSSDQLKKPIAQSHQRQLSLKVSEIRERLIKNKSVLNVVEPTIENTGLEVLLGILQQRIELDKDVLFQFTQIKNECKKSEKNKSEALSSDAQSVAPVFMRYQRGCQQVSHETVVV